jgi:hypothetical protein
MELTPENIEILDRYFRNELSAEELSRLQSDMKDAEFADAARSYLETIKVVEAAGRKELRLQFSSIKDEIEKSDGFDGYKPSSQGKGPGGGGLIISILVVIVAVTAYLFYSGKFNSEKLQNVISDPEKVDTVYHYIIQRDTFIVNKTDTEKIEKLKRKERDTVFIRSQFTPKVFRDSSGDLWQRQ